ncbi:BglG family transcription antiterminator [Enterococcus casseliflavus]|uniref:BglG family transcription antiterminator n=1 Tax=Enterococcus casseliflavus TaxID=37734 RepID=UPI00115E330A|nr:PRD domain-containing protein [Enterococcus casseliflavus]
MKLSKRETRLIEQFMTQGMNLTANELATAAKVSTKTIYRTIKRINEAAGSEIIRSEIGKGFCLDYEAYLKGTIENQETDQNDEPLERRHAIALHLLFKSPKRLMIKELFAPYYLSEAVISSDINRLSEYFQYFELQLIRSDKRISVIGTEKNIRRCVNDLFTKTHVWNEEMVTQKYPINAFDINFITSILEFIERKLANSIAYPYNMNIFSHLYILILRMREGEIDREELIEGLDEEEQHLIEQHQEFYQIAQQVIEKINAYLVTELPESEVFYLYQYLVSSRVENKPLAMTNLTKEASEITEFFTKQMEKALGIQLNQQTDKTDLLCHIQPMLYRLKNKIIVKNGLLSDIQLEYPRIFEQVAQVSKEVEQTYGTNPISEDEIGFLVLYFVKFKVIRRRRQRVLIMCSSGVGTSELLKVKVQRAFPELDIVDVLSARMYRKHAQDYQNIDLILTTINLPVETQVPTILVNSVFTKQDEKRVKQLLGEM